MSRALTPLVVNSQFQTWYNLTSNVVTMLANEVVTANTGGALTTGNGFVIGVFGANTVVASNLQGGNTSVSANLVVTSNCNFNTGLTLNNVECLNVNTTTTGTTSQVVDSFLISTWRSVEYTLTIKNGVANGYQMSKLLVLQDGGNAYVTEFGVLQSNGTQGAFTATANSIAVILNFTPIATATTIQGTKLLTSI